MGTLSAEDVRRIVRGGERFLLLDLVSNTTPSSAVQIPWTDRFVENVLARGEPKSLPIVIKGDSADVRSIEQAATALRIEGFLEVWTYFDAWPVPEKPQAPSAFRHNVVSDPDAADATRLVLSPSGAAGRAVRQQGGHHSCEQST